MSTACKAAHETRATNQSQRNPQKHQPNQMPALMAACESYLASTCFEDPEADDLWINAVYDLACDLIRTDFSSSLARHFACAAQRDAAGRRVVLSHIMRSAPYAGDGAAQMELLRQVRGLLRVGWAWLGRREFGGQRCQ